MRAEVIRRYLARRKFRWAVRHRNQRRGITFENCVFEAGINVGFAVGDGIQMEHCTFTGTPDAAL